MSEELKDAVSRLDILISCIPAIDKVSALKAAMILEIDHIKKCLGEEMELTKEGLHFYNKELDKTDE